MKKLITSVFILACVVVACAADGEARISITNYLDEISHTN